MAFMPSSLMQGAIQVRHQVDVIPAVDTSKIRPGLLVAILGIVMLLDQ